MTEVTAPSVGGMQSHELCEVVFQLVNDAALGLHVTVDIGAGFGEVVSRSEAIGAGEEDTAERDSCVEETWRRGARDGMGLFVLTFPGALTSPTEFSRRFDSPTRSRWTSAKSHLSYLSYVRQTNSHHPCRPLPTCVSALDNIYKLLVESICSSSSASLILAITTTQL